MKRPHNRRSFTYRLYCDLVCEAKLGNRKMVAIRNVASRREVPFKLVRAVWWRYVSPNMVAVQGRAVELF